MPGWPGRIPRQREKVTRVPARGRRSPAARTGNAARSCSRQFPRLRAREESRNKHADAAQIRRQSLAPSVRSGMETFPNTKAASGSCSKSVGDLLEPVGRYAAVVVGECDDRRRALLHPHVAGGRGSPAGCANVPKAAIAGVDEQGPAQWRRRRSGPRPGVRSRRRDCSGWSRARHRMIRPVSGGNDRRDSKGHCIAIACASDFIKLAATH